MPKKILLPTPDYPPQRGGVARYLFNLKQVLGDAIEIKYWKGEMPRGNQLTTEIEELSKDKDEIWTSHIYPIGNTLLRIDKPFVVMMHGMDFDLARRNFVRSFIARRILKAAKKVVTNSKALAKEVEAFAGVTPLVVYPTLSNVLMEAAQENEPEMIAKSNSRVRLLTVARLVERKGHLKVLEVIKDIPKIEYTIVGDGEYRSEIEAFIERFGLSNRVKILTKVSDEELIEIYKKSDVFIMPTTKTAHDREGFGTVYLEAGLFGVPSIAVRHPGVDEAVIHGETGILVGDDRNQLKSAVYNLVDDVRLRDRLGKNARKRALAEFTPEAQFGKLRELL